GRGGASRASLVPSRGSGLVPAGRAPPPRVRPRPTRRRRGRSCGNWPRGRGRRRPEGHPRGRSGARGGGPGREGGRRRARLPPSAGCWRLSRDLSIPPCSSIPLRCNKEAALLVKKYGNRRLYDTDQSKYITLEELAESVRQGKDVRVVDAKTGEALTTPTLAQIIIEGRGAARLLPPALLVQLLRMGDDALAEVFGQYVTWALEVYLQTKQGVQAMGPFNPFGGFGLPRSFGFTPPRPSAPAPAPAGDDVARLRKELEELKKSLKRKPGR